MYLITWRDSPCILLLLWKTASSLSTESGSVQKCLIFSSRYQLWFSSTRVNIITNSRSTSVLVPEYLFRTPIEHIQKSREGSSKWTKSRWACFLPMGSGKCEVCQRPISTRVTHSMQAAKGFNEIGREKPFNRNPHNCRLGNPASLKEVNFTDRRTNSINRA